MSASCADCIHGGGVDRRRPAAPRQDPSYLSRGDLCSSIVPPLVATAARSAPPSGLSHPGRPALPAPAAVASTKWRQRDGRRPRSGPWPTGSRFAITRRSGGGNPVRRLARPSLAELSAEGPQLVESRERLI